MAKCRPLLIAALISAVGAPLLVSYAQTPGATPRPKGADYPVMAPLEEYLIADRDAEIGLARSAAPATISSDATVMVLTRQGYQTAVTARTDSFALSTGLGRVVSMILDTGTQRFAGPCV